MPSAYRPPFAAKTHSYSSFSSLEKSATSPFIYSGAGCCRDAQQTTLKFLFRPEFSDLKLENTAKWKNENKFIFRYQSCKNVPIVPTSQCYFFWPVLIFGKNTRKTGENTRKQAKNRRFFGANFFGGKIGWC